MKYQCYMCGEVFDEDEMICVIDEDDGLPFYVCPDCFEEISKEPTEAEDE